MAVLTLMVVWSECVFFIKTPVLSLFAIFLNVATTYTQNSFIGIEVPSSLRFTSVCQQCSSLSAVALAIALVGPG